MVVFIIVNSINLFLCNFASTYMKLFRFFCIVSKRILSLLQIVLKSVSTIATYD